MQDRVERGEPLESFSRLRNRLDANISQQLGNGGNLYLNGSSQRYWSGGGRAVNFSVGYSNQWRDVSYSISAQRLRSHYEGFSSGDRRGETSTLFGLNLSIPLGGAGRGSPTLSSYLTRDSNSGTQLTSGVSGMLASVARPPTRCRPPMTATAGRPRRAPASTIDCRRSNSAPASRRDRAIGSCRSRPRGPGRARRDHRGTNPGRDDRPGPRAKRQGRGCRLLGKPDRPPRLCGDSQPAALPVEQRRPRPQRHGRRDRTEVQFAQRGAHRRSGGAPRLSDAGGKALAGG